MEIGNTVRLPQYLGGGTGKVAVKDVPVLGVNTHVVEFGGADGPRYAAIPVADLVLFQCPTCGQEWPAKA